MATEPMVQLKDDESTAFNSYDSEQETPIVTTETEQEFDSEHIAFTFVKGANAGTCLHEIFEHWDFHDQATLPELDRKSTRLNSSHVRISYAVFCLKKKNNKQQQQ